LLATPFEHHAIHFDPSEAIWSQTHRLRRQLRARNSSRLTTWARSQRYMHLSPAPLDAAIRLLDVRGGDSRRNRGGAANEGYAGGLVDGQRERNGATRRRGSEWSAKNGGGAGGALGQQRFQKSARSRASPVKLLMRGTFDVFADSPRFFSVTLKSTHFVEPLWRRRGPFLRSGDWIGRVRDHPRLPIRSVCVGGPQ